MTLAQVCYNISTDRDFAELWRSDPDAALAGKGLKISKEEKAFLSLGVKRYSPDDMSKINLTKIVNATGWG